MIEVGIQVLCDNNRCFTFVRSGGSKRRYIGLDGGSGGKWQCSKCNQWTFRSASN